MQNTKFSLTPSLSEFLSNYRLYGFKNRTAMIQTALLRFKKELELENLRQSAKLYAEIYDEDNELHELAESAIEDIEDLAAFEERADEPLISYEQIIKRLNKDGRI